MPKLRQGTSRPPPSPSRFTTDKAAATLSVGPCGHLPRARDRLAHRRSARGPWPLIVDTLKSGHGEESAMIHDHGP